MFFNNKDTFIVSVPGCLNTEMDSMESIIAGNDAGATGCQVDIDITEDSIAVLCHKGGYTNNLGETISLSDHSYFDARTFFEKVVTVGQAIELAKSCASKLCLNLKNKRAVASLKIAIKHADYIDSTYFTNFTLDEAIKVSQTQPMLNILVDVKSMPQDIDNLLTKITENGIYGIHVDAKCLTQDIVDAAHKVGLYVGSTECNDEAKIQDFIEWNVNFIHTARPDIAFKLMPEDDDEL